MKQLILVFALLMCSAAEAQHLLGQEFWPDGSLKATRYTDRGEVHFITFHQMGSVKEVGCFRNGRRHGVWKQYNESGVLLTKAGFQNGVRQGIWEFRTGSDQLIGRSTHENGVLALSESFDDDGKLLDRRVHR